MLQAAKLVGTLQLGPGKLQQAPMCPHVLKLLPHKRNTAHVSRTSLAFSCAMPPPLRRHVTKESLRRIARALPPQAHKVEMLYTLFGRCYNYIHSIAGDFTFLLRLINYFAIHSHCCRGRSSHCYEYHFYCRNSGQLSSRRTIQVSTLNHALKSSGISFVVAQGSRINASVPS